ncbi:hypothetical protein GCM10007388_47320 [Pseudoduganella plicata]|nr:hypothetical protein GCM10007388_47320 [Pseudoduganella plicata]
MVKLRMGGISLPSRVLGDRAAPRFGELRILDTDDQGLRRPVKLARLMEHGSPVIRETLLEPRILWCGDGRFTLTGFERIRNRNGEIVEYAQSWLCEIDFSPPPDPPRDTLRAAPYKDR